MPEQASNFSYKGTVINEFEKLFRKFDSRTAKGLSAVWDSIFRKMEVSQKTKLSAYNAVSDPSSSVIVELIPKFL